MNTSIQQSARRLPAEWEPHAATWIAWPHHEPDWPGKLEAIPWVYAEIVRALSPQERVEILCHDESIKEQALNCLNKNHVDPAGYRLHLARNNRCWLRDSGPTAIRTGENKIEWIDTLFNAWAKYDNYQHDRLIPEVIEHITGLPRIKAMRPDNNERLILEGGAIDTDGAGTMLTTEECLLSKVQERNPDMSREDYEKAFAEYFGIQKAIWLGNGCEGDDTHGHVDDIARFVAPRTVVTVVEPDPQDPNHEITRDNLRRLQSATDAGGKKLRVETLPMPRPIYYDDERMPASYANFYIANQTVLVPTFNDANDRIVLNKLAELFPGRQIIPIASVDLVVGQGTLHCLTQQQPA